MELRAFVIVALALAAGASTAQPAPPPKGYLAGALPDSLAILPPAPTPTSPRGLADRAIFRATRALKDTPRWKLAINDLSEATPDTLRDFSCAAGAPLTPANVPRLAAMLTKLRWDVIVAVNRTKDNTNRQRPFLIDRGPTCVDQTPILAASHDYPSGHTTWSWTVGLVLADLQPAHATAILSRARAFGESRVVCGAHNASAIEAGRLNGSLVFAALQSDPAFRADLETARAELAPVVAAGGNDAGACAAEAALTARTPW